MKSLILLIALAGIAFATAGDGYDYFTFNFTLYYKDDRFNYTYQIFEEDLIFDDTLSKVITSDGSAQSIIVRDDGDGPFNHFYEPYILVRYNAAGSAKELRIKFQEEDFPVGSNTTVFFIKEISRITDKEYTLKATERTIVNYKQ